MMIVLRLGGWLKFSGSIFPFSFIDNSLRAA